jgi:sec-independent protein translocase protein TatB
MELDELRKMKSTVEDAAREVEHSIHSEANAIEKSFKEIDVSSSSSSEVAQVFPEYKHPRKNWRLKQGATPQWYKSRNGVRTKALSGAARVARFRPHKIN